ncbi:hypothetical protein Tsubulata_013387 [Turnera subulata]|uniref:DUF1068 domain-containing protein n=1 Tax=Turnera subulata TaxID=218843 RepID=A0A9Q0G3A8_9ROSI|nr:hypothetical protein Tsubulata_013387 [Turnera subulata]
MMTSNSSISRSSRRQQNALMIVMLIMGIFLVGYIIGPPLYWHLSDFVRPDLHSSPCPSCFCDCSSSTLLAVFDGLMFPAKLTSHVCTLAALSNNSNSFKDCMRHDPQVSEEMEKTFTVLLTEELRLHEEEALRIQHGADVALLEAKKIASQYQKVAEKCSSGMDTCEDAREKVEESLEAQRKLSALWEYRARQRGWREDIKSNLNKYKTYSD